MKKYMMLILLVALVAACLIGCGSRGEVQEQDAAAVVDDSTLTENHIVPADEEVTFLQYCDGQITLRFSLEADGVWRWVDEPTFPLDGAKVEELLTALRELGELPELPMPDDLELYGLSDPQKYMTLDGEAVQGTMYIGDQTEDGSWYMMLEGADQLYTIPDAFVQMLSRSAYDMAVLPVLPAITEENLLRVAVENDGKSVSLRKTNEEWKGSSEQVTARADEVVTTLSALQPTRCFDFLPSQQALQLTGFSDPAAVITVEYLNSVNVESSFTLTLGALHSSEEGYYATISGDDTIYLFPTTQLSPLLVLLIYAK